MRTSAWAVVVLLVAGPAAWGWGQQSQDEAERAARLEVAELNHEVDRDILRESLALLKRAKRSRSLDQQNLSDESQKSRQAEYDLLRKYVDEETARFGEQAAELTRLRRDSPEVVRGRQPSRVDPEIELLEMEIEADRVQLRRMMTVLRETELQRLQGFSTGPVISGNSQEAREAAVAKYRSKFEEVQANFTSRSKELRELRRRAAESR